MVFARLSVSGERFRRRIQAEQAMHVSSLYVLELTLFAITFIVLAAAKLMLLRMARAEGAA